MNAKRLGLIAPISLIVAGCGSRTDSQGSWSNSTNIDKPISKMAVFTVGAKRFIAEATMEVAVSKSFNRYRVTSTAGSDMFRREHYDADGDGKIDDPAMNEKNLAKLSEMGFDGVLIVAVNDERTETPGYMATDVNAYLEVNLYSLIDDGLVYSAQTQTFNPTSLQDAAESFSDKFIPDIIDKQVARVNEK